MAHVSIISSQSGEQIFEGAPRYVGAYLKPGYLEFPAIGSPTAISWHVGDYVVYPRTGKTYRLYRTPQIAEQGDTMRYGAAFLYENVQFFDDSKQLELCPFTDLVPGDNTIHFSTQNVVSFFGKPLNVAERLQACLEAQYGAGTWAVRIVTTTDTDLLELLDTEVEFSVSGASCQQALDKVYELWNGLGWIHTVENGVNVITIGASNVRTNANTTVPFAYDNGLVRVERSVANADEIGTRLFAYGSMKNMDATYYRGLDIKDAESVDIEHLMIPLANWGITDNKPDARKAYIEDAAAIAKLGLIPRTAYFDGTGDLPDIHPTIERMTIGEVYDAGGAGYLPNLSKWSRSQRIDEIISAVNPTDHGTSAEQGQKYTEDISSHLAALTDTFINNDTVSWTIFSVNTNNPGRLTLNFGQEPQPITLTTAWNPQLDLKLAVYAGGKRVEAPLTIRQASSTAWQIILPESVWVSGSSPGLAEVRIEGVITNTAGGQTTVEGSFSTNASTAVTGGIEYELSKTFTATIPQIGFDIEKYAALGNGKTISMKTGMCAGRDFEIKSAKYVSSTDSWLLTLYRSSDEDLGIMFPNADYQIAAGDQYVLLDIAMPDMYVTVASNRLLEAARKLLADISSERPFYSPQIDAKVVYNESRVLLEGMWMDVAFDSSREYVLIDSITIDENGSNIPTYEVSLREKKGVEWTENVGKSSSSKSSVSVNGNETEQETGVRSVGMTVPTGLTVQGSPITGAGIFKVGLAEGYKIPLISELANYFELAADPTLVQPRQAYSYLGVRDGLLFTVNANTYGEGDTEPDLYVKTVDGTRVLYSPLPLITKGDQIVINGTPGGGGGGGVDHLYLLEDVYGSFTTGKVKTADGADVSDGQALVWDTSLGKWVAGTVGGGSTYSAGTAIKIANNAISVSGTLDADPISFDPDTHSGVDPSNPVAWGSASGPYGIKLSVNSVVKDLVLVSGYNALAARVTALENAPEGGITRIGTYQGAVTLGANLSITENGVLSATDTTYGAATTSAAGLMSAADKTKLNGIAEGATAVSDATVSGWGYAKTSALPGYASDTTAGIIKIGTGLTISDSGVVSVTGQTQGTVTRVDVGGAQYGPSASGVVSLPAYPTTLPASDVYSWAKAASKPSYAFSEISGTAGTSQIPTLAISKISGLQDALDGKQPLDADLTAIAGLTGTSGFLKKTAANAWALDTNTYLTAHQTIYQLVINNYAGTAQITYRPATSGNYSLTLTKAMVGLSNVPNWVFMITDSSTQTFVA